MAYGLTQSLNLVRASSQRATISSTYGLTSWQAFTMECSFRLSSLPSSGQLYALGSIGWATIGAQLFIQNTAGVYTLVGRRHAWGTSTTDISYTFSPSTGTWYHASFSKDGSNNGELTLNGSSVATGALGSGTGSSQSALSGVGFYTNNAAAASHHFDGDISLARIWSVKRTATELNDNKCNVFGTATSNMRAEHSLDNVYTDASGNSYTLTASGSPTFTSNVPATCSVSTGNFFSLF